MEVSKKIFLTWSILLLIVGGATAIAVGSLDPETHDFKLKQLPTVISDERIVLEFELDSFNRDNGVLNPVTRNFSINIPIEDYNDCRNAGDSARTCKQQLVDDIQVSASSNLFRETEFLRKINGPQTDFSNELNASDFNVNISKINENLEERKSEPILG